MQAVLKNEVLVWINGAGYGYKTSDRYTFKPIPNQDVSSLFQWVSTGDEVTEGRWEFIGTVDAINFDLDATDLPKSMHIAALTAVNTSTKKGTVVRKWMGENYTYDNCYVSLQALEAYQAGKIKLYNNAFGILAPENANSFVLVYFVSENPFDTAIEIPVIVDKLVR